MSAFCTIPEPMNSCNQPRNLFNRPSFTKIAMFVIFFSFLYIKFSNIYVLREFPL